MWMSFHGNPGYAAAALSPGATPGPARQTPCGLLTTGTPGQASSICSFGVFTLPALVDGVAGQASELWGKGNLGAETRSPRPL